MPRPSIPIPSSIEVVPPSGTEPPPPAAAWKEKTAPNLPAALGFDTEKLQSIVVASRPFPLIVPVPSTNTPAGWPPWKTTEDEVRSNVNPPALQRSATAPELKNHGAVNVAVEPGAIPEKLPSALMTMGEPTPPGPVHAVTSVAVPDDLVSS